MLMSRRPNMGNAHITGLTTNQTTTFDKPTVRQLKIAFQDTPLKLREIEEGWRGKRQQQLEELKAAGGRSRTASKTPTPTDQRYRNTAGEQRIYLPSPPPTPIEPAKKQRRRRTTPIQPDRPSPLEPKPPVPGPILAFPLVATLTPAKIASAIFLHVPASVDGEKYELRLDLGNQRVIVDSGGRSLSWIAAGRQVRRIELDTCQDWSEATRKQWETVVNLVERVKRKTARVKIFHPLGIITVTCSMVPDIHLACDIQTAPAPLSAASRKGVTFTHHIRLVYSASTSSIRIHTSLTRPEDSRSVFRTRRTTPVNNGAKHVGNDRSPENAVEAASRAFGFTITEDWLDCEISAVERLWRTRDEWAMYVETAI